MLALRASTQRLPQAANRRNVGLRLGARALAVGLAAYSLRSISSHAPLPSACFKPSATVTGDVRTRYWGFHRSGRTFDSRSCFRSFSTTTSQLFFSLSSSTSMGITPPQPALKWGHSVDDIKKMTTDSIEEYRKVMDKVGALQPKDCNFDSVCVVFDLNFIRSLLFSES